MRPHINHFDNVVSDWSEVTLKCYAIIVTSDWSDWINSDWGCGYMWWKGSYWTIVPTKGGLVHNTSITGVSVDSDFIEVCDIYAHKDCKRSHANIDYNWYQSHHRHLSFVLSLCIEYITFVVSKLKFVISVAYRLKD